MLNHPLDAIPTCPYCSNVVLHQMRHHHLSWFCRHCWTEVPNAMVVFASRNSIAPAQPASVVEERPARLAIAERSPQPPQKSYPA